MASFIFDEYWEPDPFDEGREPPEGPCGDALPHRRHTWTAHDGSLIDCDGRGWEHPDEWCQEPQGD